MCWVLVPASIDRVAHDVSSLRKDLLDEDFLSTQSDSFTEVRGHTHHQAVAWLGQAPLLAFLLPPLKLLYHRGQLIIPRFFI